MTSYTISPTALGVVSCGLPWLLTSFHMKLVFVAAFTCSCRPAYC